MTTASLFSMCYNLHVQTLHSIEVKLTADSIISYSQPLQTWGEKSWMIVELMLPQRESSYHLRCIQIPVVTPSDDQRSGMMCRLSGPLSSLFRWRRERLKMVRGWRQHHGACRLPGKGLCFKWFTSKVKNVLRWNVHTLHQLVACTQYRIPIFWIKRFS